MFQCELSYSQENYNKYFADEKGIISIMYHRFNEINYPSTNIQMDIFKKHIEIIETSGYEFLNPKLISEIFFNEKKIKKFLLTIDDGYDSFYMNAWPFLKENKIPFLIFISTEAIGKKGYMDWSQIKEIEKYDFVSIGNHSHSHEYMIEYEANEFENDISSKDTDGKDISSNMKSNMRNILKSIEIAENENSDLFYFLEDDYLHTKDAITEMLFTYEKISSQLNREIFLCPADYPYLYSTIDNTKLFFGNMRHWRTINETLITFLTSKKMIIKYLKELKLMGTKRHHPMELQLHKIYENEYCLSPIPSLAMHATNINTTYGLPPNFDWKKVWEENSP